MVGINLGSNYLIPLWKFSIQTPVKCQMSKWLGPLPILNKTISYGKLQQFVYIKFDTLDSFVRIYCTRFGTTTKYLILYTYLLFDSNVPSWSIKRQKCKTTRENDIEKWVAVEWVLLRTFSFSCKKKKLFRLSLEVDFIAALKTMLYIIFTYYI